MFCTVCAMCGVCLCDHCLLYSVIWCFLQTSGPTAGAGKLQAVTLGHPDEEKEKDNEKENEEEEEKEVPRRPEMDFFKAIFASSSSSSEDDEEDEAEEEQEQIVSY